jgi:hypothetical protein
MSLNSIGQSNIGCFSVGGSSTEYAKKMAVTYDGNYVIAGFSNSFGVSQDCYIIKVDPAGIVMWSHQASFGGNAAEDFYDVMETSDHSIVATGVSNYLIAVVKYSETGVEQWSKTIAVSGNDVAYSVIETSDGGYLIVGYTETDQIYVIKLSTSGSKVWEKTFHNQDNPFGGDVLGLCVNKTIDEHYIIGGWCPGIPNYYYALCLDSIGNVLWAKQSTDQGASYDFAATPDSGFVMAGFTYVTSSIAGDAQLAKFDKAGNLEWSKIYGSDSLFDAFYSVEATTDGGFIMAGEVTDFNFINRAYIMKTDDQGNVEWSKVVGGPPFANAKFEDVKQTSDGGYAATGGIGTNVGNMYAAKFDANGNICPDCHPGFYGSDSLGTQFTNITMVEDPNVGTIADVTLDQFSGGDLVSYCFETGVENVPENISLTVYPNPSSSGIFEVSLLAGISNATMKVCDVTGKILMSKNSTGRSMFINLSDRASGVYFLFIEHDHQQFSAKLIK